MVYLCEREIGFDAAAIGFPSIDGCRAIVLVTGGGLFGLHLNGSLSQIKKDALGHFVNAHAHGNPKRNLYVASRMGGNGLTPEKCYSEIKEVALALGFNGSIYWADLTAITGGSLYVVFDNVGNNTCAITARPWSDHADHIPANQGPYAAANRAMANGGANAQMYINVNPAGLRAVYPAKFTN
jgi:hypothetical protein